MNLTVFSEHLLILLPPLLLSFVCTIAGSLWIDRLYRQEKDDSLLSFPDQIAKRAKFRKPLLFFFIVVLPWENMVRCIYTNSNILHRCHYLSVFYYCHRF